MSMDIINKIKNNDCDEVDLLEFITDNNVEIAISAAESSMATGPILDIASRDKDKRVRIAALRNPNIEGKTIEYLTHDSDEEVSTMAKDLLKGK